MMRWIGKGLAWLAAEFMTDHRENKSRAYELALKNNQYLNQIILTVSIASLAAIAALNKAVFAPYPELSFAAIAVFVSVILLSTINFYISGVVIGDIQRRLGKNLLFPLKVSRGEYKRRFEITQNIINKLVLYGFCLGLIVFLSLLGVYILGEVR